MENSIVLDDESISRSHASISFEAGRYYLTDHSSNGTFIFNRDLSVEDETVELLDGDILRIGDHELRVSITAESPAFEKSSHASPLRGRPAPESSDEREISGVPHPEIRPAEQAKRPSFHIETFSKQLSIDDFFQDTEEEEDARKSLKPGPDREVSPVAVLPDHNRRAAESYAKEPVTEEFDKFFKDLDDPLPAVPAERFGRERVRGAAQSS